MKSYSITSCSCKCSLKSYSVIDDRTDEIRETCILKKDGCVGEDMVYGSS